MRGKLFLLIATTILIYACERIDSDSKIFHFGEEKDFRQYQTYYSPDRSFSFSVDSIHDSRCPVGAACIWAGEARVFITVYLNSKPQLVLSTFDNQKDTIQNYEFHLIDVLPYPDLSKETSHDDLQAIIEINKLND